MGTRKISTKEIENIRKWLENNQDSRSENIQLDSLFLANNILSKMAAS